MDDQPNRIGFRLQVRPELIDEYRARHAEVWPEMREALTRCGWHNYSLFLDADGVLFGYFETPGTLADAVAAMQARAGQRALAGADGPVLRDRRDAGRPADAPPRGGVPPAVRAIDRGER